MALWGFFKVQKSWYRGLGRGPENWHFLYVTAPTDQAPGECAQAYQCGGGAAGLGLRDASTDGV